MISITEKLVLDPIHDLSQPQNNCIESELVTRIIGVATSIFALIDLVANIVAVTGATVYILAKSIVCCYNTDDYQFLSDSILNIFKFTMLTAFGSVFGVLFPNCLISNCVNHDDTTTPITQPLIPVQPPITLPTPVVHTVTQPVNLGPSATVTGRPTGLFPLPTHTLPPVMRQPVVPGSSVHITGSRPSSTSASPVGPTSGADFLTRSLVRAHVDGKYTPSKGAGSLAVDRTIDVKEAEGIVDDILAWALQIQEGTVTAPFTALKDFYETLSFDGKLIFYETFSEDVPEYAAVRKEFTPIIFQSKHSTQTPFTWLSDRELLDAADALPTTAPLKATLAAKGIEWNDSFHRSMYYHATKSIALIKTILRGKRLEVRQGCFYGMYISTQPEYGMYGRFVFAFKEKIAHTSPQVNATNTSDFAYWSGLAGDVDLDSDLISYIMVAPDTYTNDIDAQIALLTAEIDKLYRDGVIARKIPVISYNDIEAHIQQLKTLPRGLPAAWVAPGAPSVAFRTAADVPALYGRKTT